MTHHVSGFMKSLMYLRHFCDEGRISDNFTLKLTFDDPNEYATFVRFLLSEMETNVLACLYRDPLRHFSDKAWYEEFMLMGVNVQLTYKGKK